MTTTHRPVYIVKREGVLLKGPAVADGKGSTIREEKLDAPVGRPIPHPERYGNLDHLVAVGLVEKIMVPIDAPAAPARTYAEPDQPVRLVKRHLPTIHHHDVLGLVTALEAEGVTVTGAAHYRELHAARDHGVPAPASVLDMTPTGIIEHAQLVATHQAARSGTGNILAELRKRADQEMAERMAAEADDYLDALRPVWNTAVAEARRVRDAGVPATVKPEQLVDMDPDKIRLWSDFRASNAIHTLERITRLRIAMAEVLEVAEGRNAPHHSWGISNPVRPSLTSAPTPPPAVPPIEKWLDAAYVLDLVPIRDFTDDAAITAAGFSPADLRNHLTRPTSKEN
ncbi:hypothetical protein IOE58_10035 [Brachybacterium sp. Marseille-Q2903]|uniref:Uncharacterized protein n=1 Tax=Brachybacterium epidermidis TaxID=2781983 RepID=A0ABR9W5D5_9MICO|nr:hypothetical protein [Brachybacterium epidermidis]MBE9404503.1 hypothetical protein [Brachybacterium epidermidis]